MTHQNIKFRIFIIFELFFLLGLTNHAYSFGFTCGCITYDWSNNVNRVSVCKSFATQLARDNALSADRGQWSYHCDGVGSTSAGDFKVCSDYFTNGEYNAGVYAYCPDCLDSNSDGLCDSSCSDQKQAKATECGGIDYVQCDAQCNCSCIVPSGCSQEYEALCVTCGSCNNIKDWSGFSCLGHCKDCSDVADDAAILCGAGRYILNPGDCSYTCKDCSQLTAECTAHCSSLGKYVSMSSCTQNSQNIVTSSQCVCGSDQDEPPSCTGDSCPSVPDPFDPDNPLIKTCDYYRSRCNPSCNFVCTPGVGGMALSHNCDCSSANPPLVNPETPPQNPSNPDDSNGWLKGIKEGIDSNIKQNNDILGWIKSQKENSDSQLSESKNTNNYLGNIAENNRRATDNLDAINKNLATQSKAEVDATNNVASTVGSKVTALGDRLGPVMGNVSAAVSNLREGLTNVNIGATDASSLNNLGDGDAVTGAGYGAVGTTGLLPSSASIQSSFGTYAPSGSGYVGIARSSFSKIEPVVSGATCSSTLHLPSPTLSGIEWKDYPFDLCPYEQYISMIGNALVFLTALFELFKLAS